MTKRLYVTKKRALEVFDKTKALWHKAMADLKIPEWDENGMPFRSKDEWDAVSVEYRRLICQLPTDDLTVIVKASQKGFVRRSPITINAILDEIARRELLGDKS